MQIKSGHLLLTLSWIAMGAFCYWCDPVHPPVSGPEGIMLLSGIWLFCTILAGVVYGAVQTLEDDGGEVLLNLKRQPKLTGPQTGKGHLSKLEE